MLEVLDAAALRRWCRTALDLLGLERERIDSLNVFPVADADTGTNLYLTLEAACEAVEAGAAEHPDDFAAALRDLAHGAFLGARGNSGVILSQILRGMAEAVTAAPDVAGSGVRGKLLSVAFARASRSAYDAVSAPADGTILTVVRDVADAMGTAHTDDLVEVVQLALSSAITSLAHTPDQMPLLRRHGVVDAGGAGLVVLLDALVEVVTGIVPTATARSWDATYRGAGHGSAGPVDGRVIPARAGDAAGAAESPDGSDRVLVPVRAGALGWPKLERSPGTANGHPSDLLGQPRSEPSDPALSGGPRSGAPSGRGHPLLEAERLVELPARESAADLAYEVMYLLEAPEASIPQLRRRLEPLGDSILVVGGDDLWNVHVHANDVGAVIEAGLGVGRPYRIRVSHLTVRTAPGLDPDCDAPPTRAVVLVVEGEGIAALAREAGAIAVAVDVGATAGTAAVQDALTAGAPVEAIVIPGAERFRAVADAAAEDARRRGVRASVVPVRAAVQALAALAVHDPARRFDDDVVAMTAAAGATRYAAVAVAERQAITSVGVCEPGDVLGLLDGDVVLIAADPAAAGRTLVERLLGGGGELVTLVHGDDGAALAKALRAELRSTRPDVECVVYAAGATSELLLLGVE